MSAQEPVASPMTASFLISAHGDGRWSGKLAEPGENDGPFATVQRAQEAVRALIKTLPEPRTVRVVLRAGTYHLHQPLRFGLEDSGAEGAPSHWEPMTEHRRGWQPC